MIFLTHVEIGYFFDKIHEFKKPRILLMTLALDPINNILSQWRQTH